MCFACWITGGRRHAAIASGGASGNLQCGARFRRGGNRDAPGDQSRRRPRPRGTRTAAAIRDGINAAIRRRGLNWCAYGQFSDFHLYRGDETPEEIYAGKAPWQSLKGGIPLELVNKIRAGFLLHGVDIASLARRTCLRRAYR